VRKYSRRRADNRTGFGQKIVSVFKTIPFGIFVLAVGLYFERALLPAQFVSALSGVLYITALVGMILSAGFNRSRVMLVMALIVIGHALLTSPNLLTLDNAVYYSIIYYAACLIIPLNLLVFSLVREAGPLSGAGKRGTIFIALQLLVVSVALLSKDQDIIRFIANGLIWSAVTPIPLAALVVLVVSFVMLLLRQSVRKTPVENAFLAVLLMQALAFQLKDEPVALTIFYASSAVTLMVAAIQDTYAIAYLDELTGLPSRRSLQEEMAKLKDRYTIAMLDIDHFKKFNDQYGHQAGDDVLRFVAGIISREVAGKGKAFRYGGEEFTVLYPGREAKDVLANMEALRERICNNKFFLRSSGKKNVNVTISIGWAEKDVKLHTSEQVITAADEALYRAKEKGRNCVSA
jgi:diguanylate cyclase (GGDEF)-like protein